MRRWFCNVLIMVTVVMEPTLHAHSQFVIPQKFKDQKLTRPAQVNSYFSKIQIENGAFVDWKAREWASCHQLGTHGMAIEPGELSEDLSKFIESRLLVNKLKEMANYNLIGGLVERQPWSGDYWPYATGILGARPFDADFTKLKNWLERFQFVSAHPAKDILRAEGEVGLNRLSPSEKYDLWVGDESGLLTSSMWSQGRAYYDDFGQVEVWMGICHGWAAASIIEPRPAHTVHVLSFDKSWKIPFRPAEMKGLLSYTWAKNPFPTSYLGKRCEKRNPLRDQSGRLVDPECWDLNPATWHLAIVNRLGIWRKSFIFDTTYDYQVWNQPVVAYGYSYFNPKSGASTTVLEEAMVKRTDFAEDRFAKFRSETAQDIVGITMVIGYVVETMADDRDDDAAANDVIQWVSYRYDLELNSDGEIVGGEWHQAVHPDFMWTPLGGARPQSVLDRQLDAKAWQAGAAEPLPTEWAKAARVGSAAGVVLDTLIRALSEVPPSFR